ncbi:hypothetical protein SMB34_15920 [Thalassospira permensis NBRC 106175]|uniref:Uncharacterized protein n=1 Tax=Thalassospira permensis NBRC 106175 TaxID=1353532 RepID=A0ABR4TQM2_9PROT|nr:hypothetical protein SMB34_15920 [Thalassospira permensis NBRC 106175]
MNDVRFAIHVISNAPICSSACGRAKNAAKARGRARSDMYDRLGFAAAVFFMFGKGWDP